MRRIRFWINITFLIVPPVLLTLGTVTLTRHIWDYLNTDARLAGLISTEATRALGREVRVRDVKFRFSPWNLLPNRVELSDISIAQYPSLNSALFAHTDKLVLWYDFGQILFPTDNNTPLIKEVQVIGPNVTLNRNAQGQWNFEQIFKPSGAPGRPFTTKLTFSNATLFYSDLSFPHPVGVPRRPFYQRLKQVGGIVLFRPDKSVSFSVGGKSSAGLLQDFHAAGIAGLNPLQVDAQVTATQIDLPAAASRIIPRDRVDVKSGTANMDVSLLYTPNTNVSKSKPVVIDPNSFDFNAITAHGTLETKNLTLNSSQLDGPLQNVRLKGVFTTDSFSGSLRGQYAGIDATVEGQILGLLKQEKRGTGQVKTVLATPTISLRGQASQVDIARAVRVFHLDKRLQSIRQLTPEIRQQIVGTSGQVSGFKFTAAGALNNPVITATGHIDRARSFGIAAANTDVRAQLSAKIVSAEIRGTVEGGMLAANARVSTQDPGTFAVEAHARKIGLEALRPFVKREISGRSDLDLTMRGRRGETPFISAQAQASDISVNKQTFHSLYARATTVGHNLLIRQIRVEDPKGLALVTGVMDLRTQQLRLNVAADNLDLHAVLAAALPAKPKTTASPVVQPNNRASASNSAFDPAAIQGQGFLRGKLEGTLTHPEFAGRLSLFDVQSGAAELDRVIADFSLSREALVIGKGLAERYPGQLTFSGRLEDLASGDPKTRLRAQAKSLDIPDLLRLAGVQSGFQSGGKKPVSDVHPLDKYVILGTISSGLALVEGRVKSLKLSEPVTVQGVGVSINGLPVTNLSATVALNGGNLDVQAAHADIAGGTISLNGTLDDIAGKLEAKADLSVQITNLDMSQLETAFPAGLAPVNLNGTVNLNAIMRGPLNAPHVTANVNGNKILLTDDKGGIYEVGNIQAEVNYTKDRLVIDKATIREAQLPGATGELQLEQVSYDPNNKMLSGLAKWDQLRLERLRYLFNQSPFAQSGVGLQVAETLRALSAPIQGTISGEARVNGVLDDPSVAMIWNTSTIHIEDHSITAFTGSAFINKEELRIPAQASPEKIVKLQSDDIDIEIPRVLAFFKKGGALDADIRANKLNLEFLHHFSPVVKEGTAANPLSDSQTALRALQNISGNGTAEFVASGTTDKPVVEASINLHDVAYKDPLTRTEYLFNRIDVSHLTAKEGTIDTDIIEILKTGTDQKTKAELRFEANAQGKIDFSWTPPFIQKDATFDVRATVPNQDIKVLSLFKQDLNVTSDGHFALTAHLFNKINDYRIGGSLRFDATKLQIGTVATGLYQTGFRDIAGELDFLNDRIQVRDGFTARTQIFGKNGKPDDPKLMGSPIQLTGSIPLRGNSVKGNGGSEGIRLRADRIFFEEPPLPGAKTGNVRGEMGININLAGSVEATTIGGLVTVTNTTLIPPSDLGSGGGGNFALPINPKFDLLVRLDKNVRVQNPQLDARIEGTISVKGPLFVAASGGNPQSAIGKNPSINSSASNKPAPSDANEPPKRIGLNVLGRLNIQEGKLKLPTARFVILSPGGITLSYPSLESSLIGIPSLGVDVDLRARTRLFATSLSGIRKSYTVTVAAHGPITGSAVDPATGTSRMTLDFTTDPNDLAVNQQGLQQRLAGVLGGDAIGQFGRNPGQVLAQQLSNVFTTSVVPNLFDKLGFDEFQIGYDPIQGANLIVSRQIFGPFYVTYNRTLGTVPEMYNLKLSLRFRDRFQLSYEQDQSDQQRTLLEGVWKF